MDSRNKINRKACSLSRSFFSPPFRVKMLSKYFSECCVDALLFRQVRKICILTDWRNGIWGCEQNVFMDIRKKREQELAYEIVSSESYVIVCVYVASTKLKFLFSSRVLWQRRQIRRLWYFLLIPILCFSYIACTMRISRAYKFL